ncbi:glycoside hydrolase family 18 protein [Bacillus aerolatus]|nr:LysM peptidoglycan-binding domain-containing protein [Bacillus aerolatus]
MAVHTVMPGDTLWKLSSVYGVPISALMRINGLVSGALVPGLNLYIPDEALPERFYQVKAGDTLWKIAQTFQSSVQLIIAANPSLSPNKLKINERLRIPTWQSYTMQTLVFMDAFDPTPYLDTLKSLASHITYLAIFTYSFTRDGMLIQANDEQILKDCKQNNIKPLMVVSNYEGGTFSTELADHILNPARRPVLIRNIVTAVIQKGYAGVSVDFEFVSPTRRQDFTAFVRELKRALGRRVLQVNAHAKTGDQPTNRLTGFLDYRAIGEAADITAVMTIDYGYALGPPAPISPVWWIEQVLTYVVSQIDPRKLMMAINLYGYDWTLPPQPGRTAAMLTVLAAQNQAIASGVPIQFDSRAQSPSYRYRRGGLEHAVSFEDVKSVAAKYELMEVYNLLGTTYWRLRFSFPQNWAYVNKNIRVEK